MGIVKQDEVLADRRKALEEEFFRKQDQKLIERLRQTESKKALKDALTLAGSNLSDSVVERLVEHGVTVETVTSLTLVPLVAIAWADGTVEKKEREAVLKAAAEKGIAPGTAAHDLLEAWLNKKPDSKLVRAWEEYIAAIVSTLSAEETKLLKTEIVDRARQVASAAGGFLGMGPRISAAEQSVLEKLERAFAGKTPTTA